MRTLCVTSPTPKPSHIRTCEESWVKLREVRKQAGVGGFLLASRLWKECALIHWHPREGCWESRLGWTSGSAKMDLRWTSVSWGDGLDRFPVWVEVWPDGKTGSVLKQRIKVPVTKTNRKHSHTAYPWAEWSYSYSEVNDSFEEVWGDRSVGESVYHGSKKTWVQILGTHMKSEYDCVPVIAVKENGDR